MLLHILGLIGKGIGITLLGIVLVLLVCVLVLLFVPIRYYVSGTLEQNTASGKAGLHWLFHAVSAAVVWEAKAHCIVRLFGIPVYDNFRIKKQRTKKQRTKKQPTKKQSSTKQQKKCSTIERKQSKTEQTEVRLCQEPPVKHLPEQKTEEPLIKQPDAAEKRKTAGLKRWKVLLQKLLCLLKKICCFPQKILEKLKKIRQKAEHAEETIRFYREFIKRKDFQCAWALCKKQLFGIWKNIRPKKLKAEMQIGFEDPAVTGQLLAYAGMLYPILGKDIKIRPDFEKTIMEGTLYIKGRITLFVLLKAFLILYFDKNIRRLVRIWKKEEIKDGRK